MQEEIFGPILPVVAYRGLEDAIAYVNARPRPLALYFFGADGPGAKRCSSTPLQATSPSTTRILHYAQDDLPFGGVGASGMGAYHGHRGLQDA